MQENGHISVAFPQSCDMNKSQDTLTVLQENQHRSVAFSESCDVNESRDTLTALQENQHRSCVGLGFFSSPMT